MENGCPFMMSWNEGVNTGFMTAKDNDVIAHEKRFPSAVDGVICAFHGGAGHLNNWLFLVRTTACKPPLLRFPQRLPWCCDHMWTVWTM